MNYRELEALLDELNGNAAHDMALIASSPVSDMWQLQRLLGECETPAEAHAVIVANAALAEQMAGAASAYALLCNAGKGERPEVERLLAEVRGARDPATAEALLAGAEPADYAAVAEALAMDRMSADDLQKSYFALVEIGK